MLLALILAVISGPVTSLLVSYLTFSTLEGIHELRDCTRRNPSGGYYQKWSIGQHLAAKYLLKRFEIMVSKLPQGGYNVMPYRWKTLRMPGDSYKEL